MEQPGIPAYVLIMAIGVVMLAGFILFSIGSNYLRSPVRGGSLPWRVMEPAGRASARQAPGGLMAERRQNIEEPFQRKEREPQD